MTVRYQRQMPAIVNHMTVPWFPDEGYLITELASRLCELSDDQRALNLHALADTRIRKYLQKDGDKQNRSQSVQLDARSFASAMGGGYRRAKNTKVRRVVMWRLRCAMLPRLIFRPAASATR